MSASPGRRTRFDLLELVLVAGLAALVGGLAVAHYRRSETPIRYSDFQTQQQAQQLRSRYGADRYSENEEEWAVRDFFKDRRDGVFVDVGANDYKANSNTYYLEHYLGWSGLAVDPQPSFAADYARHRPRTRFFSFFVDEGSSHQAKMYVLNGNPLVSSSDRSFVEAFGPIARALEVPTITLTDLLVGSKVGSIDFLSIDVEMSEPKVLAGFEIDRFKPRLVCIESHAQVRQRILDYFARHRYVVVGDYLRLDVQNLYFKPLD